VQVCTPYMIVLLAAVCVRAAEEPAFKQVGLCYTGFGVPGSGRPYVLGDLALVNAGEGYPTVCDVSDPRDPKVLRHIPSWFFTTFIYPLPSRDLAYLSSSRGRLLALRGLKDIARRGALEEIAWEPAWGRSFLSGLRPDGIGYTVKEGNILVLDLSDPDHPKETARVPQSRLKTPKGGAHLLAFSEDYRLAAALLDGGAKVGILEWKSPTEATLCGEFDNAEITDKTGAFAYGRVLAMDNQRVAIGHPASTDKYWRCLKLTFWDIRDPRHPKRLAEKVFDQPGTHIRDFALAGRHAYAIDGREISSGHTVRRTQRSRLYVLDLGDLDPPTRKTGGDTDKLEDDAVGSPKTLAVWEDTMPTEYSQMTLVGNRLYVNDYNFGLWVFDVGDPAKPAKLGGVPVSAEGHWLHLAGDYAYMAHTFGGTIHVIRVADPAKPETVGYYWDGQWLNYMAKIRGRGRAMYLPQFDGLAIVDLSQPASPKRLGEFLDGDGQPLAEPCLEVEAASSRFPTRQDAASTLGGSTAFVTSAPSGKKPSRLLLYDVADEFKPRLVGSLDLPEKKGFRVLATGNKLYLVAYGGKRILTVDAADPKNLRLTADLNAAEVRVGDKTYSTAIKDGGGNGAPGIAFSRGYLYVTTGGEAPNEPYLLIFDVRDPAVIRPAGALHVPDRRGWQYFACDVLIDGNRLFLGDYGCEEVYDLTDPLQPRRLARYRRAYTWQVGTLRGNLLYVPKLDGLEILECPAP